ncbi:MAG TPA: efflux RND transporter permease subunit, partial [Rhizomicrobium sp.]|nr:efflux RND transporter permease subunit [Rhizomicrobium sp.]
GITGRYAHLADWLTHHTGRVFLSALAMVVVVIGLFAAFNRGVEFFVDTDPDQASVLISARGNLSAKETRDIVMGVNQIVAGVPGIKSMYATTGGNQRTLNNQGGVPVDNVGRITVELKDFKERGPGKKILEDIRRRTSNLAGIHVEVREPQQGPPTGKALMIDVASDNYVALSQTVAQIRKYLDTLPELRDLEDTRPLPGIEWNLDIDRQTASRFGANAQTIGTAVQLVTNGVLVGKYRPDDADDEIDIRVRYPEDERGVHALDNLRVPTANGVVPISNFVRRIPAQQVSDIERINGHRVYHVRANLKAECSKEVKTECIAQKILPAQEVAKVKQWLATQVLPDGVRVEFKGADEQQDESGAFLVEAAFLALFLIAIVLLALFNSFYHSGIILVAVVLAMIGALLGMVVMGQTFSIIMTGTGMLALAGIVVNHNIVLIDTFHRLRDSGMEPIEAVIRSSAQRLRPVFLTTITAIGGLLPMMFGVEINFATRAITVGGPNASMWIQLSTAIVFGLAFSKMITLGLVPAMLAYPYRRRERKALRRAAKAGGHAPLPQPANVQRTKPQAAE